MRVVGDILATLAFVNLTMFVAFYAMFAPWWRTPSGRSVMGLVAVLAATFGLTVGTIWFGVQWPAREFLRAVIFGAVAVASGQLLRAHVMLKVTAWRAAWRAKKTPERSESE